MSPVKSAKESSVYQSESASTSEIILPNVQISANDKLLLIPTSLQLGIFILSFAVIFWWSFQQGVFFLERVAYGVPPDEVEHVHLVQSWSRSPGLFLPDNQETSRFGPVSIRAPFYYIVNGSLLHLFKFLGADDPDYTFLRILSLISNLGTLIVLALVTFLVSNSYTCTILATGLLSSILMFNFLSGAVNYDPFNNFLCSLGFYYFCRGLLLRKWSSIVSAVNLTLLTCLTKIASLPIALSLFICFFGIIIYERKNWSLPRYKDARLYHWLFLIFFSSWAFSLYGLNLINYGKLYPNCAEVRELNWCMENVREFRVNRNLASEGPRLTFGEYLEEFFPLFESRA